MMSQNGLPFTIIEFVSYKCMTSVPPQQPCDIRPAVVYCWANIDGSTLDQRWADVSRLLGDQEVIIFTYFHMSFFDDS